MKANENISKIAIDQGYDYTAGCLLDYSYLKENYKLIAIDLRKRQEPDGDPKGIQQINSTGNLDRAEDTYMFFIFKAVKETILDFFKRNYKSIVNVSHKCFS